MIAGEKNVLTSPASWASAAVPTKRSVLGVAKRLKYIFRNKEVEDLDGEFAIDAKNKWFGIDQGSDGLTFNYTDRLTDISILESNDHNAADRFPYLVSFVDKTGTSSLSEYGSSCLLILDPIYPSRRG